MDVDLHCEQSLLLVLVLPQAQALPLHTQPLRSLLALAQTLQMLVALSLVLLAPLLLLEPNVSPQ
jgi:hypothetical protein